MAFWKKSEDPWDISPEKQRSPAKPAQEKRDTLLDSMKDWGARQKAAALKETVLPPELCPWCGKSMAQGYISGSSQIWWAPGSPSLKSKLIGANRKTCLRVDDEGSFYTYKTTWYCQSCEKMVLSAAGMERPFPYDNESLAVKTDEYPDEQEQTHDL